MFVTTMTVNDVNLSIDVGTGAELGFKAQESTNKTLAIDRFGNTCEEDVVSPEVEAGVVSRLRCLKP
jgi:hypothetical protein